MIRLKTENEINVLQEGGAILAAALKAAQDAVRPGVAVSELDRIAETVIRDAGAEPAFKGYCPDNDDNPFPSTLCVSVNEQVVHGLGNQDYILRDGDIVSLDVGVKYKDMFTDAAMTLPVGNISDDAQKLLNVTREALNIAVSHLKEGNYIHDMSKAVEAYIEKHGYGLVRELVGHGVGHAIHEEPAVPNFHAPEYPIIKLKEGMVLAVEPMVNMGDWRVETLDDGWTVVSKDRSLSAHYEFSVAVTKDGPVILTPWHR